MIRVALILIALLSSLPLLAETTIGLSAGWGQRTRPGRWVPIFLSVESDRSRDALAELYLPADGAGAMVIRQSVAIGPEPAVFQLYAPLHEGPDRALAVVLRDAVTGRTIASHVMDRYGPASATFAYQPGPVSSRDVFIGVSGRGQSLAPLERQLAGARLAVGFLPASHLPTSPIGYNALDVLILNQPDFNRTSLDRAHLSDPQQHAILDWIRAGGHLLIWPGEQALPPGSPLLDALPARIGEVQLLDLTPAQIESADLPQRFTALKRRALMPAAGVESLPLVGDAIGYRQRLGLGTITMLPFDALRLTFQSDEGAERFWRPLLEGLVDVDWTNQGARGNRSATADDRQATAVGQGSELLASTRGARGFEFPYLAVLGMMVILGPLDWLVLRLTGRQSWTATTAIGWIGLFAIGVIWLSDRVSREPVQWNTLAVVDQVNGETVGATRLLSIEAGETQRLNPEVDSQSWWRLAAATSGPRREVLFHQNYRGNSPMELLLRPGEQRLLLSEQIGQGPPVLEASLRLRIEHAEEPNLLGRPWVSGTISNVGSRPISDVRGILSGTMSCQMVEGTLEPGQTAMVDAPLEDYAPPAHRWPPAPGDRTGADHPLHLHQRIADLAALRSIRIDRRLREDDSLICLLAKLDSANAATQPAQNVSGRQIEIVRALLPIDRDAE